MPLAARQSRPPEEAPTPTRRARRRQEVHERILEAAVDRFERQGVEATKVDDICAVADVAQKTFFNHFPTKQHLIREIASTFLHELLAILEETRRTTGTTGERLGRFFTRIADDIDAASPMRRELVAASPMRRELVMEVIRLVHGDRAEARQSRPLRASFGVLLRDGVRAGDVTRAHPLPVLTQIVMGAFYALMLDWVSIDGFPMRARATGVARFLATALAAERRGR
jgi:TetR/AcrR family transcriptional regulator, regulator of autoinduction and epiphytic fitness